MSAALKFGYYARHTGGRDVPQYGAPGGPVRVLVVDDDRTNRMVLTALLHKAGHSVLAAPDGAEAVAVFERERPDLVLMDVMMPVMDGYEAARRIKALAGEHFVPVVFLTALGDETSLSRCIECGGDDFMTKPFNHMLLASKIQGYTRLRELYGTLRAHNEELAHYHARLAHEHEVAEEIFTAIVDAGRLNVPNIKYLLAPLQIANGDVLLAATTPCGRQHVLLGDFAGHGLSAAIGAIPVSDIFYSMTAKGFRIRDIVREINRKLYSKLPTGFFLAACVVEVDAGRNTATVWNGGIPDALLWRNRAGICHRFPSRNLPLGIVPDEQMGLAMETTELRQGDRLYLYSDGLIEATNLQGEMFGQARLEQCLTAGVAPYDLFDELCTRNAKFRAGQPQADDITMVEITFARALLQGLTQPQAGQPADAGHEWRTELTLSGRNLQRFDALPALVQMLVDDNDLRAHKTPLYTVVTELVNNALDHGILELDAACKDQPDGFFRYYEQRDAALEKIEHGNLRVLMSCRRDGEHGTVLIRVEDSGRGFDPGCAASGLEDNTGSSGRGIALVRSLCRRVQYSPCGNSVEAEYVW